jgi:hypothetical protein
VRIWGNVIHDVLTGISFAPAREGPVYAIRNLIYRTDAGDNEFFGLPFKFNSSGYGPSGTIYLFHNTVDPVRPNNAGLTLQPEATWKQVYARNNIWTGTHFVMVNTNTSQVVNFDSDDLWTWETNGPIASWGGTRYDTLDDLRRGAGIEPTGYNVDPRFANRGGADYTLSPASPLVDKGVVIAGINDGYSGSKPDVGAFERPAGRLTVTTPLTFSPANPTADRPVTATYTVTNTGGSPVSVAYLMVGVRDSAGANVDIGATPPLTLQPGQSYAFSMSRQLPAGSYTAWPASYDGSTWTHLAGNTTFTVR